MAKPKLKQDRYARQPGESSLAHTLRRARMVADERDREEPIVPVEAQRHGSYASETIVDPETGSRNAVRTLVNRGGTPLCRWRAQKKLSETQLAAIGYCLRLWELSGHSTSLTASYGERTARGSNEELRNGAEIDARRQLHRIQGYIPAPYWNVFEAVVRFDQPAGVAGSDLANSSRNAKHTAYLTVCFVADFIAMKEGW